MARILVVEDDLQVAAEIVRKLEESSHDVTHLTDGLAALNLACEERFDAITVDCMLPGLDGLELVKRLRLAQVNTPVLMISALVGIGERIEGLRAGGDDYLVKPFSSDEMAMRVEVLLRRQSVYQHEGVLRAGALEINLIKREISLAGAPILLRHKEFRLLECLVRHQGQTVSRRLIFEQVWGCYFDPSDNLINAYIKNIRRKIDNPGYPSMIQTMKGEGYRLTVI